MLQNEHQKTESIVYVEQQAHITLSMEQFNLLMDKMCEMQNNLMIYRTLNHNWNSLMGIQQVLKT